MSETIAFYILSAVAVIGALVAVRRRNLVHGVFALMSFFAALAGLFLLLLAEFIAAVQVLVYIGAVGILLLFGIMLTERVTGDDGRRVTSRGWFWGAAASVAVFVFLLLPAIQQTPLPDYKAKLQAQVEKQEMTVDEEAAKWKVEPSVKALGEKLMDPYVVTLEVLALLLTAALIGAVAASQGAKVREEKEDANDT